MRDDLTTRMSSSGRSMNLTQIAKENYLPTIRDNLNFEFQGRYLFAGSRTDAPPVGDIVNNSNVMNGAITSNYYNGNSVLLTASASNSLDVAYGINADNQIFQNLIACANKIITADTNNDQIGISQAFDIANTAINDLTQLRATLDNNLSAIQDVNTDFTNQQIYLTSMISNTEQTDFPKVTAQLISDQTSLTASYKAFAMMSKMNLGNFLGN
jgi:flagellar hook-associated protein 3 FlgL